MINPALLNLDDSFDLPAFLLGEIYGPMQEDGKHIEWSMADAISLADDLKQHDDIDADPQEIYELMMEFDAQDNEDAQEGEDAQDNEDAQEGEDAQGGEEERA